MADNSLIAIPFIFMKSYLALLYRVFLDLSIDIRKLFQVRFHFSEILLDYFGLSHKLWQIFHRLLVLYSALYKNAPELWLSNAKQAMAGSCHSLCVFYIGASGDIILAVYVEQTDYTYYPVDEPAQP